MADGKVEVELRLLTEKAKQTLHQFAKDIGGVFSGVTKGGAGVGGIGGGGVKDADAAVDKHIGKLEKLNGTLSRVGQRYREVFTGARKNWSGQFKGEHGFGTAEDLKEYERARGQLKAEPPSERIAALARKRERQRLADLDRLRATKEYQYPKAAAIPGLANQINAQMGIGQGGQAAGYSQWWQSALNAKYGPVGGVYHGANLPPVIAGAGKGGGGRSGGGAAASGSVNDWLNKPRSPMFKFGAALAALRVGVGLVDWGFRGLLAPIKMLDSIISRAAESARGTYAKSLQSGGVSVGLTAYRGNLARVLGVGENEVFQYGKQVTYLSDKLRYATYVQARYNSALTESAWQVGVFKSNWSAMMTTFAMRMKDAKMSVVDFLDGAVKHVAKVNEAERKFQAFDAFAKKSGLKYEGPAALDDVKKMKMQSPSGPLSQEKIKAALRVFEHEWALQNKSKIPPPETSAHRYATSSWERMGLVVGAATADNPAKKTAYNTTKMLIELQKLTNANSPLRPPQYRYTKPTGAAHA